MKQYQFDDIEAMQELISDEFGQWSEEVTINQELIDMFAELSGDDYWLHTNPEKCAKYSPFKSTIAHGFLTLVLLSKMRNEPTHEVVGFKNMMNAGSNKLRFTGVVPVGSTIHCRSRIKSITGSPKGTTVTMEQNVHVVGEERPALVYEMMFIYM